MKKINPNTIALIAVIISSISLVVSITSTRHSRVLDTHTVRSQLQAFAIQTQIDAEKTLRYYKRNPNLIYALPKERADLLEQLEENVTAAGEMLNDLREHGPEWDLDELIKYYFVYQEVEMKINAFREDMDRIIDKKSHQIE